MTSIPFSNGYGSSPIPLPRDHGVPGGTLAPANPAMQTNQLVAQVDAFFRAYSGANIGLQDSLGAAMALQVAQLQVLARAMSASASGGAFGTCAGNSGGGFNPLVGNQSDMAMSAMMLGFFAGALSVGGQANAGVAQPAQAQRPPLDWYIDKFGGAGRFGHADYFAALKDGYTNEEINAWMASKNYNPAIIGQELAAEVKAGNVNPANITDQRGLATYLGMGRFVGDPAAPAQGAAVSNPAAGGSVQLAGLISQLLGSAGGAGVLGGALPNAGAAGMNAGGANAFMNAIASQLLAAGGLAGGLGGAGGAGGAAAPQPAQPQTGVDPQLAALRDMGGGGGFFEDRMFMLMAAICKDMQKKIEERLQRLKQQAEEAEKGGGKGGKGGGIGGMLGPIGSAIGGPIGGAVGGALGGALGGGGGGGGAGDKGQESRNIEFEMIKNLQQQLSSMMQCLSSIGDEHHKLAENAIRGMKS